MFHVLIFRTDWDDKVIPDDLLLEELRFWFTNIRAFNGYSIRSEFSSNVSIYSDASSYAFGGYSIQFSNTRVSGMSTDAERAKVSTFRELKAIIFVLSSYAKSLVGKRVTLFTDNQAACRILSVGSRKPELQQLAMDIFNMSLIHQFLFESKWLPRALNEIADCLSKFADKDDWKINPSTFILLNHKWGSYTIDRFASLDNNQLPRFNSRFLCPESEAVDAFSQNREGENNWLCPPPCLIVRTIRHLRRNIDSPRMAFFSFLASFTQKSFRISTFCQRRVYSASNQRSFN